MRISEKMKYFSIRVVEGLEESDFKNEHFFRKSLSDSFLKSAKCLEHGNSALCTILINSTDE